MRVTTRMMVDSAIRNMQASMESLNRLQEKTISGKQFQKMSDDPAPAALALSLHSSLQTAQSYGSAAMAAADWMGASDYSLSQIEGIALQALNKVRAAVTDTLGADERKAFAVEINEMIQQTLQAANAKFQGSYLFSGYRVRTAPYGYMEDAPDRVEYQGDDSEMQRNIGPNQLVKVNVTSGVPPTIDPITGEPDIVGPFDELFVAMIAARDALEINNGDSARTALGSLEGALNGITNLRGDLGSRQSAVQAAVKQLEEQQFSIKNLLTEKEDLSLAEAISELRHQETTYQAVLEVSQRTLAMTSLFDYLR